METSVLVQTKPLNFGAKKPACTCINPSAFNKTQHMLVLWSGGCSVVNHQLLLVCSTWQFSKIDPPEEFVVSQSSSLTGALPVLATPSSITEILIQGF